MNVLYKRVHVMDLYMDYDPDCDPDNFAPCKQSPRLASNRVHICTEFIFNQMISYM